MLGMQKKYETKLKAVEDEYAAVRRGPGGKRSSEGRGRLGYQPETAEQEPYLSHC